MFPAPRNSEIAYSRQALISERASAVVVAQFHPLARVVEERIMSEISLYGICPRTGPGTGPPLLFQNGEDSCRGLAERTWSKQSKVPNCVSVDFRDVLGPTPHS
jgi:hypothetical protein